MTNAKEKKKIVLWLIVLAILAAAAFTVTAIVRHNQRPAWDGGYSVHISEVMTDNKTCPNGVSNAPISSVAENSRLTSSP